ncbi:similar to Saccharomyces cerevisiae YOR036W PEP12 Target membrane receptor (t-SNARE) for vesicular intermediates traveling between the Golgi apparatus and the vacuole [Maudiozyma barnettii]|uniref:Similar to Saccharomyces cerevisiae YOR036W PEP12 Target membrane receptor (t-SNARE) for vesicular intermediates traveling between the Golgi apparatus and the vacuole n=1 Tax=Maudiozyma barnettii TaxID=61262 RepID=A0A8H2VJ03_9SACH|nr:SNAP receptor PEP12 [Kazachstania barnettii]CAB4256296.1 similar to Saccharomyces cerevisiae YOR036W PEP12 Target membrane receptor (t-SNARE) for vesicular intermediates traveling between the Golgi apparatus and the vacuole [Kazachstania barnettii]CAD1784905.1 similar to Saccharomyces cerevisiae YOR036W PEP12 Target membrane receptor (t-SNARE) for vesicular intermediates traveling between the Golgi apparatus and the vacuole [Kazachstania barnettii]
MIEPYYTDDGEDVSPRYTDSPEFDALKDKITNQLFEINGHISTLNQFVSSLNSFLEKGNINVKAIDNIDKKSVDKINRVTKLITEIEPSLKELNQIDMTTLDRTQSISRDKLSRDVRSTAQQFQITQMAFTKIIKSINNKAKHDLHMDANATSLLQEQENEQADMQYHTHDNGQVQVPKPKQSTIVVEMDPINNEEFTYQQNLINERDQEISNIQQGMTDLNEIFKDLGAVVQQQGIMVDNIEANIYSASNNTNMASGELDKARRYQRRSSKYCLYLLIVLSVMLFFLLLIIFI